LAFLATTALAAALKRQEAAERTSAMAISMLANVQKSQQAAKRAQMSANIVRSLSPTLPHPMSYVGAILSTIGEDCQPSSQILQSTTATKSAAITLHQTARQRKRPRRRPGCRNVPRAPNPADEAIPSHPLPSMGGTSTPTTNHTESARANDQDPRSPMSSIPPFSMMSSSPSSLPFNMSSSSSTNSKGRFLDFFRDGDKPVPPQKRSRHITVLVILAVVMAPGLLIYRSTFSAGGDIGSVLPTNLHVMAGNRGGRGFYCFLFLWRHFCGDNFLG
jgi:hypothetical protein